jgi:hypothetical protein
MLGLLLGTLPPADPAPGAPPDAPPPTDDPPGSPLHPDDPPNDSSADDPPNDSSADDPPNDSPLPNEPLDLDLEPPDAAFEPADLDPGAGTGEPDDDDDAVSPSDVAPAWPPLPAGLPYPGTSRGAGLSLLQGLPPEGLLDVLLPWSAYTGTSAEPAVLGRYGPVTPCQSAELLGLAPRHPGTQWRIVLTDRHGHAQAVERFRLSRLTRGDPLAGPLTRAVVGRLTVTIPEQFAATGCTPSTGDSLRDALLRAAVRARARAGRADTSAAYRPPPRLREYVAARDITCTFPTCRQQAWRTDLDHTVPWHRGGATSSSNLGARCRTHHKIKQLPGWKLEQSMAGAFAWTTPAGNTYTTGPRRYAI